MARARRERRLRLHELRELPRKQLQLELLERLLDQAEGNRRNMRNSSSLARALDDNVDAVSVRRGRNTGRGGSRGRTPCRHVAAHVNTKGRLLVIKALATVSTLSRWHCSISCRWMTG